MKEGLNVVTKQKPMKSMLPLFASSLLFSLPANATDLTYLKCDIKTITQATNLNTNTTEDRQEKREEIHIKIDTKKSLGFSTKRPEKPYEIKLKNGVASYKATMANEMFSGTGINSVEFDPPGKIFNRIVARDTSETYEFTSESNGICKTSDSATYKEKANVQPVGK